MQVLVDCATLDCKINRWTASAARDVKYSLSFTLYKVSGMGGSFDKNSFILGMKFSFLENTCSSL